MNLSNFRVPENFRGKNIFIVQLWWFCYTFLFKPSPQFFYSWRRLLLRLFGADIGNKVLIRPSARITYPWKLKIGNFSWIGDNVWLYNLAPIVIGTNTVISQNSYLCTGSHDYKLDNFDIIASPIAIGDRTWLASNVFVAPGVTILNDSVIGSTSAVFSNLPAQSICYGNPCKVIKPNLSTFNKEVSYD